MKKKIIVASAASAVLAAMPVVGVFAVTSTPADTVKDTLNVTVTAGCTMTRDLGEAGSTPAANADKSYNATVKPGHAVELTGTAGAEGSSDAIDSITISCNSGAYRLQGVGTSDTTQSPASGVTLAANQLMSKLGGSQIGSVIPSSVAGDLDGSDSEWGYKIVNVAGANTLTLTPSATLSTDGYQAVPTTPEVLGSMAEGGYPVTFTPNYKVSAAQDLAAGTYTGSVTYSILEGAGN